MTENLHTDHFFLLCAQDATHDQWQEIRQQSEYASNEGLVGPPNSVWNQLSKWWIKGGAIWQSRLLHAVIWPGSTERRHGVNVSLKHSFYIIRTCATPHAETVKPVKTLDSWRKVGEAVRFKQEPIAPHVHVWPKVTAACDGGWWKMDFHVISSDIVCCLLRELYFLVGHKMLHMAFAVAINPR